MMKIIIIPLVLLFCSNSYSAPYYRFWRGYISKEMSPEKFLQGLNKIFIPETVEQGREHGLIAYMPVLVPSKLKENKVPDELALVVYESEEKYQVIRKMPRGESYQKLHWDYFDKATSKSLVPSIFDGEIQIEKAYDLLGSAANWQDGVVQFIVRKFKKSYSEAVRKDLKEYFLSIKNKALELSIASHLVLVDKRGIYEYVLYSKKINVSPRPILISDELIVETNIILENKNKEIGLGEGVNRQFTIPSAK